LKVQILATIANRQLFVNGSTFYGTGGANATNPSLNPIRAIEPGKVALLPGARASVANFTNYSLGINGIVVDIANPGNLAAITATSFQFAVWNNFATTTPNFVSTSPLVTVSTIAGGGQGGSDRIKLVFPNNTFTDTWLRVTVLVNTATGLTSPDIFYFGSVPYDVNSSAVSSVVTVNAIDLIRVRRSWNSGVVNVANRYLDADRSGRITIDDWNATRQRASTAIRLRMFTAPASAPRSPQQGLVRQQGFAKIETPIQSSPSTFGGSSQQTVTQVTSKSVRQPNAEYYDQAFSQLAIIAED